MANPRDSRLNLGKIMKFVAKSDLIFHFLLFQVLTYVKTALGAQNPFRKFKKVEGEEDDFRGEEDDFRGDEDEDLFIFALNFVEVTVF